MIVCEMPDCARPRRKRQWCETHYTRWKTHGTPAAPGRRDQSAECSAHGCQRKPLARDLCRSHYYGQKRRAASAERPAPPAPGPCAVATCNVTATARGWCGSHYQRWRRFGDPEFHPPAPARLCSVDGCDRTPNARQLCGAHYRRWSLYGDALATKYAPYRPRTSVKRQTMRLCPTCGNDFDAAGSARKYCGKLCKPSGRIAGSVNKRTWVVKLGDEDGWVCWLCSGHVDRDIYWPNPSAGSVDHVLPVSHGGTDERHNLRLSHLSCNTARKNRLIE